MLSVETVPCADRADGTGRQLGGPTGGLLKRLVWRTANCCLLGGLLTWPLERSWVRIEELPIPISNLGWEFDGTTLVHLSDLHCGALVREKHLQRYVEIVNSLDADFVAITGDFITTGSRRHARAVARALRDMRANRAVVACLGNHDYGRWHPRGWGEANGIADFLSGELADAGVVVLRNESRAFFHGEAVLQFVGVEDYWSPDYDPRSAFELVDPDSPVITLAHNPDAAPQLAAMGANWILAGHTHGKATPDTRFWDAVYPTRHKQFVGGRYALGAGRHLYVNRGIGNTLRVCCEHRPEITLFTLRATTRRKRLSGVPSQDTAGLAQPYFEPILQEVEA